jgi:acetyl esterase/lipase
MEKRGEGIPKDMDMDAAARYGIADAVQALKVVREHAPEWALSRERVGILGFSAGGMVASGALLQADPALRPSFAGLVYGAPFGAMPSIPRELPPIFMAWAQDDEVARAPVSKFRDALIAAGHKPDVHVYTAGGHGFGLKRQGTTSDHWIDEFYYWLEAQGLTSASKSNTDRSPGRNGVPQFSGSASGRFR